MDSIITEVTGAIHRQLRMYLRDSTSICNLLSTSGVPYNDKTVPYVHLMNYSYLSYK